jgi:hypothetical protein
MNNKKERKKERKHYLFKVKKKKDRKGQQIQGQGRVKMKVKTGAEAMWPPAKEHQEAPEAGRGWKNASSRPSEGAGPHQHLDFQNFFHTGV